MSIKGRCCSARFCAVLGSIRRWRGLNKDEFQVIYNCRTRTQTLFRSITLCPQRMRQKDPNHKMSWQLRHLSVLPPPHMSRHMSSGQENNLREPMISYGLWQKSKDVCFSGNNSNRFGLLKRIINLNSAICSSHHLLNQIFPVTKLGYIFQGHQEVCLSAELGHNVPPLWQTRLPHGVRQPPGQRGPTDAIHLLGTVLQCGDCVVWLMEHTAHGRLRSAAWSKAPTLCGRTN